MMGLQMRLPNGEVLMHSDEPYDPQKAHEYYLATRQLKGRKKGSSFKVLKTNGQMVTLSAKELAAQKAYAAKRVTAIQGRLTDLNTKLKAMIQAEGKSATPKVKTAADKTKAAAESKKSRDKHKTQIANKAKAKAAATPKTAASSGTKKTTTVADLQTKIQTTKVNLLNEVAKQRALAAAKQTG
jgi:beta-mannanase